MRHRWVLILLGLVPLAGCGNPDRSAMLELGNQLTASWENEPPAPLNDKRASILRVAEEDRASADIIDQFLTQHPQVSTAGRTKMETLRDTLREFADLVEMGALRESIDLDEQETQHMRELFLRKMELMDEMVAVAKGESWKP